MVDERSKEGPAGQDPKASDQKDERDARLKAALKANLARRKAQKRARSADGQDKD
ncbi:hypothetical protein AADZ90_015615 [Aestuariibius sp. 2305UL40-4]|uniref:hypothetical protein n=1 Tax=Aestuariibius violaceus TaxID=3234132 RepID=UPI00345EE2D7